MFALGQESSFSHHHLNSKPSKSWREKYSNLKPVSEEEFLLQDRLTKIRSVVETYGEEKFYISFSGGKDSTVLSALVDLALPQNKIPRVYANTGIELDMVRDFVFELAKKDERFVVLRPKTPIKPMLERDGYPFKSKNHARLLERYQRGGMMSSIESYLGDGNWGRQLQCPKVLRYQFAPDFDIRVSDKCCMNLKEKPLDEWGRANGKNIAMIGVMRAEHGRRENAKCLMFSGKKGHFQPLAVVTKEWEEWFIKEYDVKICDIYKPPYNFLRSGCKGCPLALNLEEELATLEKFFPAEKAQCEIIWQPIYAEYRRLGYRLPKNNCA